MLLLETFCSCYTNSLAQFSTWPCSFYWWAVFISSFTWYRLLFLKRTSSCFQTRFRTLLRGVMQRSRSPKHALLLQRVLWIWPILHHRRQVYDKTPWLCSKACWATYIGSCILRQHPSCHGARSINDLECSTYSAQIKSHSQVPEVNIF